MGKPQKEGEEEENMGNYYLFCELLPSKTSEETPKYYWLLLGNTTLEKIKAHQERWFPGEEHRLIDVEVADANIGDKRLFMADEFVEFITQ